MRINSKKLPLDTRTHHPIFLKTRAFLLSRMTGSSICHCTGIAALSRLRQGENNLQEAACSFDMCSGQISHQSLTSPANAASQRGSNCNISSRASQPCPPLYASVHTTTRKEKRIWLPTSITRPLPPRVGPLQGRDSSQSVISHSRQQTLQAVTASRHSGRLVSCI